jgi:hypothetical protein
LLIFRGMLLSPAGMAGLAILRSIGPATAAARSQCI